MNRPALAHLSPDDDVDDGTFGIFWSEHSDKTDMRRVSFYRNGFHVYILHCIRIR